MNTPEAIRLADYLDQDEGLTPSCSEAAAELRRLHEQNQKLLRALKDVAQSGSNLQTALQVGGPEYGYADWLDMAQDIEDIARAAIAEVEK